VWVDLELAIASTEFLYQLELSRDKAKAPWSN
jgi:hypothetical protein